MKKYSGLGVALLFVFTVLALLMIYDPRNNKTKLRLGLDLKSGSHIAVKLLEAPDPMTGRVVKIDQSVLEQAMLVFQRRLNPDGTKEIVVTPEPPDRLIVEIPEETDLQKAEDLVRQAARLEFKEQVFNPVTKAVTWKTVLDGRAIVAANSRPSTSGSDWEVTFDVGNDSRQRLADLTRRLMNKPLGIFFDGREVSAPIVQGVMDSGSGVITHLNGRVDPQSGKKLTGAEEAQMMANLLNAGALPVDVKILESYTVSPTLGAESLRHSLVAGALGLGVVCAYMSFYYALPGVMASFALVIYTVLCLASMNLPGLEFVLTLPGIAGFVLSIGMAVDANVLIFERLKEELWEGRSVRQSVQVGFERAWPSIVDGHVTTAVGAFILYYFGSATIKGFGLTLLVGTGWSLITATMFTRTLIEFALNGMKITDRKYYGA